MTSILRQEDTALYNYLKYEVLPQEFIEEMKGVSFIYDASSGVYQPVISDAYEPSPFSEGRGIVPFDDTLVNDIYSVDTESEQITKVSLTGPSSYTVDYVRGYISNFDAAPTSMDFYWNYVSVLDSWPGETPPPLPVISLDTSSSSITGYQLGGGKKYQRTIKIHIFATSRRERDELTDLIEEQFFNKRITVKDYTQGGYLSYDGTYNSSFDHTPINSSPVTTLSVSSRFLSPGAAWDNLNRYRSMVSISYESYN
jgi:hypothetical protein